MWAVGGWRRCRRSVVGGGWWWLGGCTGPAVVFVNCGDAAAHRRRRRGGFVSAAADGWWLMVGGWWLRMRHKFVAFTRDIYYDFAGAWAHVLVLLLLFQLLLCAAALFVLWMRQMEIEEEDCMMHLWMRWCLCLLHVACGRRLCVVSAGICRSVLPMDLLTSHLPLRLDLRMVFCSSTAWAFFGV